MWCVLILSGEGFPSHRSNMPPGGGKPMPAAHALCSEFPDLEPHVVNDALTESGGVLDVARTSLVATSWQRAGSQQQQVGPYLGSYLGWQCPWRARPEGWQHLTTLS